MMPTDTDYQSDSSIDLDDTTPLPIAPTITQAHPVPQNMNFGESSTPDRPLSPTYSIDSLDLDDVPAPLVQDIQRKQSPPTVDAVPDIKADDDAAPDTAPKKKRKRQSESEAYVFPPDFNEVYFSDDDRIERLERRPRFNHIQPQRPDTDIFLPASKGIVPGSIGQWLRDYQIQGAAFLHNLFARQQGGILGDDMGLGKTVQVIAFLTAAFGKTGDSRDRKRRSKIRSRTKQWYPRILLVCPGSLIQNWREELVCWGWWDVDVFHGSNKNMEHALINAKNGNIEIMITTYTTYVNRQEEINQVEWDCVIADECHCMKGKNTHVTEAMNKVHAQCRIGLTGTAMQNNYSELWSLLHWTNPEKLGTSREWNQSITEPLKRGQSHDATIMQLGKARKVATNLVQNLLPRYFLRRTKALIADQMPKKFDRVVFCPLTRTQAAAYKRFVASDIVQYLARSSEVCDCEAGQEEGYSRGSCCYKIVPEFEEDYKKLIFPCMIMMSKLSNHLILSGPNPKDPEDKRERDLEMMKLALGEDYKVYIRRTNMENFADLELYGKWKVLRKLLEAWKDTGSKVLVFSHSTRLLEILQVLFHATSYTVCYLDGKMTLAARAAEVAKFNSDPHQFIFCISTKAGGVGLNITSANKVVIIDPNWNPAYDLQAQDRAFRIGQTRDVEVFRLVSSGTIEEIIYARQIYKQQQAAIAYTGSNERRHFRGVHGTGDRGDIFGLVNLFAYSDSLRLKDILDKTEIAEHRAGVDIATINVDVAQNDGNEKDTAMSQVAKALGRGLSEDALDHIQPDSQADPVQAILSQAGIAYTHENTDTLGSSHVENELSAKARQSGQDPEEDNRRVFKHVKNDEDYQWDPPEDVRKRHFLAMAKEYGEEVDAFAVRVENWSAVQRREFLDDFYHRQRHLRPKKKTMDKTA